MPPDAYGVPIRERAAETAAPPPPLAGAGELADGEDPRLCALREFAEETGTRLPEGALDDLGEVRLRSGKHVTAFAVEGDLDPATVRSNTFEVEWPPRSGRRQAFPEIDRAEWFDVETAREKLNPAQAEFLDRLP